MQRFNAFCRRAVIILGAAFVQALAAAAPQNMTTGTAADVFSTGRLGALRKQGALVSALVVNLRSGQVLAQCDADGLRTPASVTKLLLGAAVLEKWGTEHTFLTSFYKRGNVENGELKGDLVFWGAGDPSLTNEKIWFLTSDLARRGIKKISGKLVVNDSLFKVTNDDSNREAAQKSSSHAYDSPLSAAAVNFSVYAAVVSPAEKEGKKAVVGLEPYLLPSVTLNNQVTTQGRQQESVPENSANNKEKQTKKTVFAKRTSQTNREVLTVSGSIPVGASPERIYRSTADANRYTAEVLVAFLKSQGVLVAGGVSVESTPLKRGDKPLAEVEGFPIDWQLRGLFKMSNNFIADMLTLQLGTSSERESHSVTLEQGTAALQSYTQAAVAGCPLVVRPPQGFTYRQENIKNLILSSGSGLTPENKLSSLHVVCVLQKIFENTREFPAYLASLPIPGAEGTVRRRFRRPDERNLRDRLRAKTGTLTHPLDAVGLAGYSRLHNGDWAAFSVLVNGSAQQPHFGVEQLRDAIDADLANVFGPE